MKIVMANKAPRHFRNGEWVESPDEWHPVTCQPSLLLALSTWDAQWFQQHYGKGGEA